MHISIPNRVLSTTTWASWALSSSLDVRLGYCSSSWLLTESQSPTCSRNDLLLDASILDLSNGSSLYSADNLTTTHEAATSKAGQMDRWFSSQECVKSKDGEHEYCAYTNPAFASGRGIALWTTPGAASRFVDLFAFTAADALVGVNYEPNPPYVITCIPGKGMGLIANKTLRRGDHIFSNTPLYIADSWVYDEFELEIRSEIQHRAIHRLPSPSVQLFNNLMGHFEYEDHVDDVINTNCFAVDLFDGTEDDREFYVVIPEISRLNHDCRPNAHFYFDPQTLTQHVHAIRTILPGEEVTISYMDAAQPRQQRREHLQGTWGFHCSCPSCAQPDVIGAESDSRIREIISLQEKLTYRSANSTATPKMAELLVSLYEQEHMWAPIAEAYALAAFEYSGVGDVQLLRKYARLAAEAQLLYSGPHSGEFRDVKSLLKAPSRHWSWRFREGGEAAL